MRQIILDTETTGIGSGHRLIEIGCLEMIGRRLTGRNFHFYLNPEREVDPEAMRVHGLSNEFLRDKALFADIADAFIEFVRGAELVIHNAPFDIGFLNVELGLLRRGVGPMSEYCTVLDTLVMAKSKHPGQRNSLDALAKRYGADQRDRSYHGALLDSEILAEVYLAMTGGQVGLSLSGDDSHDSSGATRTPEIRRVPLDRAPLPVIAASEEELARHEQKLIGLDKAAGGSCLWRQP